MRKRVRGQDYNGEDICILARLLIFNTKKESSSEEWTYDVGGQENKKKVYKILKN